MDWRAHNISVVKLGLMGFSKTTVKKEVLKRMRIIAQKLLDFIESGFDPKSKDFPEYTANLHDATGIGIYADGVLDRYMPVKRADKPQQDEIGEEIWGASELSEALTQAATRFSKGLWLVVFSSVPYAERIEKHGSPKDRGKQFFSALAEKLGIDLRDQFGTAIMDVSGNLMWFVK